MVELTHRRSIWPLRNELTPIVIVRVRCLWGNLSFKKVIFGVIQLGELGLSDGPEGCYDGSFRAKVEETRAYSQHRTGVEPHVE